MDSPCIKQTVCKVLTSSDSRYLELLRVELLESQIKNVKKKEHGKWALTKQKGRGVSIESNLFFRSRSTMHGRSVSFCCMNEKSYALLKDFYTTKNN